jgi:hypothetical protein
MYGLSEKFLGVYIERVWMKIRCLCFQIASRYILQIDWSVQAVGNHG